MNRQQKLVLYASILASFVAFLDIAVVNVALPAIRRDLGGGLAAQQWVVDAYLLLLGSLILIAGSLSDLFGRKRVLVSGLVGFALASILCAVAPNIGFLIVARAFQGIAGALLVPSSLALIIANFSGAAQGKAIGTWTAWTGISFIIGPLVGGFLVDNGSWRMVFAINLIPIAATLWILARIRQKSESRKDVAVDFVGAILCALGLGGPVFALIDQPRLGWSNPLIYLPFIVGGMIFVSFLVYERHIKHPMLPLSLFKHHNFSVGNVATLAIYAGLTAWTFLLVLFLQQVGGYSALGAGMALVPVTLILFVLSPKMGALAGKYGPRWFMGIGPLVSASGFLLFLRITADVRYFTELLPGIILFGIGLAITVAPLTAAILGDVEKEHAGVASAVNNAVARVAGLLAVAAIGAIVATQFGAALDRSVAKMPNLPASAIIEAKTKPLDTHLPPGVNNNIGSDFQTALQAASVSAFRVGVLSMAGLLVVGGLVSAIGIRNPVLE
jgi:EmrB/QacA subfamily drug resistance transporter